MGPDTSIPRVEPLTPGRIINSALWNPLVTGPLLFTLLKLDPEAVKRACELLKLGRDSKAPLYVLAAAVGLGLVSKVNGILSQWANNNWTSNSTWNWSKEIVVVTGGCSGIGRCIVEDLAQRGIKVVSLDIQPPATPLPKSVLVIKTDIASTDSIRAAAKEIRAKLGEPSVIVNNAGVGYCSNIMDVSERQLRTVFNVNIISHWLMAREFLPHMIKTNHGHFMATGSTASLVTIAQNVEYSATKLGVIGFYEGLNQELKHRYNAPKVRTSVFYPYWIRTGMTEKLAFAAPHVTKELIDASVVSRAMVKQILTGNGGHVVVPEKWEVARIVRALPAWIQELVRDGQKDTMNIDIEVRKEAGQFEES